MKYILYGTAFVLFSSVCQAALPIAETSPYHLGKNTKTGEEVILQDYTGKVSVIMFWASWCDYCYKTLPAMEAVQEQLGLNNLQVITIAVKDDVKTVKKITAEMPQLTLISSTDKLGKVLESFGDDYLPNIWIIDRNGRIAAHMPVKNDEDLIQAIKRIEIAVKTP